MEALVASLVAPAAMLPAAILAPPAMTAPPMTAAATMLISQPLRVEFLDFGVFQPLKKPRRILMHLRPYKHALHASITGFLLDKPKEFYPCHADAGFRVYPENIHLQGEAGLVMQSWGHEPDKIADDFPRLSRANEHHLTQCFPGEIHFVLGV